MKGLAKGASDRASRMEPVTGPVSGRQMVPVIGPAEVGPMKWVREGASKGGSDVGRQRGPAK